MSNTSATLQEKKLITACITNTKNAMEHFIIAYGNLIDKKINNALYKMNVPISQSKVDMMRNEIFLHLFDKQCKTLKKFDFNRNTSLAAWLRAVTFNKVLDILRRRNILINDQENLDNLEDHSLQNMNDKIMLQQAIEKLEHQEQLVIKFYLKDIPAEDIARMLQVSVNYVYNLKTSAIKNLKEIIGITL